MKYVSNAPQWRNKNYRDFKTGLSYYEVWQVLRQETETGKRTHVTRHTVLGKWHEMKLSMYEALLDSIGYSDEVPF
jgi:hypothetical protein